MRRFFLIFFFLISFMGVKSQEIKSVMLHYQEVDSKPFHFGFTLGLNTMDFSFTPSMVPYGNDSAVLMPELNNLSLGGHVSMILNVRLNSHFDFRFMPGIALGQRNVLFYQGDKLVSEMSIESTFIDVPMLIKYKSVRIDNYRPYLIGGLNFRADMARNKDFDEVGGIYIKLDPIDLYYELGFGIDFYLPYFKLSTEIKYSVGLFNVLSSEVSEDQPQYAESIDQLESRLFMISFHFE